MVSKRKIKPFVIHKVVKANRDWICRACKRLIFNGGNYLSIEVMPFDEQTKYPIKGSFCSSACVDVLLAHPLVTHYRKEIVNIDSLFDKKFGSMLISLYGKDFLMTTGWKLLPMPKETLPEQKSLPFTLEIT